MNKGPTPLPTALPGLLPQGGSSSLGFPPYNRFEFKSTTAADFPNLARIRQGIKKLRDMPEGARKRGKIADAAGVKLCTLKKYLGEFLHDTPGDDASLATWHPKKNPNGGRPRKCQ